MGRHITLHKLLRRYRNSRLDGLLERKRNNYGRPRAIPEWAEVALCKSLQEPQGFDSYQEICDWLESKLGISAKYKTVHQLVHYRLQASPLVPRQVRNEQSTERMEAFKKTLLTT